MSCGHASLSPVRVSMRGRRRGRGTTTHLGTAARCKDGVEGQDRRRHALAENLELGKRLVDAAGRLGGVDHEREQDLWGRRHPPRSRNER